MIVLRNCARDSSSKPRTDTSLRGIGSLVSIMADADGWASDEDGDDFGDIGALAEAKVLQPPPQVKPNVVDARNTPVVAPPPRENAWMSKNSGDVRTALKANNSGGGRSTMGRGPRGRSGGDAGSSRGGDRWGGRDMGARGGSGGRNGGRDGMGAMGGAGGGSGRGGRNGGGRGKEFTVFVGNVAPRVSDKDLSELVFRDCNVREVRIPRPVADSYAKVAFVEMADEESFKKALSKDGFVLEGKPLRVNPEEGSSRDRGGSFGGGGYNRSSSNTGGSFGGGSYGGSFGSRERDRERAGGPGGESYGGSFGTNSRRSSGYSGSSAGGNSERYTQPSGGRANVGQFQGPGWNKTASMSSNMSSVSTASTKTDASDTPVSAGRPKLKLKPRTKPIPKSEIPKTPADGAAYLLEKSASEPSPAIPANVPDITSESTPSKTRKPLRLNSDRKPSSKFVVKRTSGDSNGHTASNSSQTTPVPATLQSVRNITPEATANEPDDFIVKKSRGSNSRVPNSRPATVPTKESEKKEAVEFANSFAALEVEDVDE